MLVPEEALSSLAAEGINFSVEATPRDFTGKAIPEWVREQVADGFAQFETGEFEEVTREDFQRRLAERHAAVD